MIEDKDEDHKSDTEFSKGKHLQDNLPLIDFVKENDQCDAYLSDFEFREDIVNDNDSSFEPPNKKFKNDLSVKLESIDLVLLSKMKCTDCGSFFVSEESLQEHKKQIHKSKNSDQSEVEPEAFKKVKIPSSKTKGSEKQSEWNQEIDPTDGIIKFKCEECGKFCITELGIRKHTAYIHQNAEIKNSFKISGNNCEKCNKSFASKSNLNTHIKSVHENVQYNCDKCDKSFSLKHHLKHHIESIHENVQYICDKCDKSYSWKASLEEHIKSVHKSNNSDQSEVEPKAFKKVKIPSMKKTKVSEKRSRENPWNQDIDPTDGIIKYKCEDCGEFFITGSGIRKHTAIIHQNAERGKPKHTGYNCDKCDKSFSQKANFIAHIKSVHENVRYKCDKCNKNFTQKGNLDTHVKSVHDNVQFNCDKCKKSFSSKNGLTFHIRSIHENVRFDCDKCDKSFSQKGYLNTHIKSVHFKK